MGSATFSRRVFADRAVLEPLVDLVEDICEDVVIIDAGRVVRAGYLAELRAEVSQRS